MVSRLRITAPIRSDQTLASFAGQLASMNHQPSTEDFCKDMGTTLRKVALGEDDAIARMAEISGNDPDTVALSAFRYASDGSLSFRGQRLTQQSRSARSVRFCARCLCEDIAAAVTAGARHPEHHVYGRPHWLCSQIRTCVRHGVALSAVDARRGDHQYDFAGALRPFLGNLGELDAAAAPARANGLELYLSERFYSQGSAYLDGLGYSVAARFCEVIGSVAKFGPRPLLKGIGEDRWHLGGGEGYAIASRGPDGILPFLSTLKDKDSRDPRDGPHIDWGILHDWLEETRDPELSPLLELARDFIASNYAIAKGRKILGRPAAERKMHSVTSAAIEHGVHAKVLRNQLVQAGVIEDRPEVPENLMLFPAAPNEDLLRRLGRGITAQEARERIDCDRSIFFPFVEAGILAPVVDVDTGYPLYDVEDLERFLDCLVEKAVVYDAVPEGMTGVVEARRRLSCTHAEVANLILDRRLSRVGVLAGRRGYPALLVDPDEIGPMIRKTFEGVVPNDIIEDFGIAHAALSELLDTRLPTTLEMHPSKKRPQRVVERGVYDAFKSRYVSLRDLARIDGVTSKSKLASLRRRGIGHDPTFPAGAYVYQRDRLD
ncbi:TniQ protein [Devosia lucknowensis]|jgi:hypothetical protein|uniref:TniQ protein n=1 Tax=Devosia lucknowensis TaxID=1096929 RepID=A0A1Y6F1C8_9HYPH|nr:TniQ family protein [Devosia lucknowensis]SMQ68635.1 TniQ protein [Devosia lucknowensis]